MNQYYRLTDLHFQGDWLVLTIDGEEKKFLVQGISPLLAGASEEERNTFEIPPPATESTGRRWMKTCRSTVFWASSTSRISIRKVPD